MMIMRCVLPVGYYTTIDTTHFYFLLLGYVLPLDVLLPAQDQRERARRRAAEWQQ